ncbi:MAG: hypothetical protein V3S46_06335 [Nitrospinota bacterium]
MGKNGNAGFYPESARLSPKEIVGELKRIEAEYEELESFAAEMVYGRSSFSASRFFMDFFTSRLREISERFEIISKAISRIYN